MTNRWIRFLLASLAIAAASAAAYRVVENEQRLAQHTASAADSSSAAATALSSVDELKSTLHAYVAPGQEIDFWASQASVLLDGLRTALLALDADATAAGAPLAEALDACDRLAATEVRVRGYARDRQTRLAGEIIFTEARDLLQDIRGRVERSRQAVGDAADAGETHLRREQMFLTAGGAGVLAVVMLLLVPTGGRAVPAAMPESAAEPAVREVVPPATITAPPEPAPVAALPSELRFDAENLAGICRDLAALADSEQLAPLLDRARTLLEARGVIVWLRAPDRGELQAVAASGYDERIVAKIGSITKDASNMTADAFRNDRLTTSAASDGAAAALAVPLPAPGGPAGVFSAELAPGVVLQDAQLSAAKVIAAQLGAVLGAVTAKPPDEAGASPSVATAQWSS